MVKALLVASAGFLFSVSASADTLFMKNGPVEGEIVQEDDQWVRILERLPDGSKRDMRYSKAQILKIKRTRALKEDIRSKGFGGGELTDSERSTVHHAVEAAYDRGLSIDEAIAAVAVQFGLAEEEVVLAHVGFLFDRKRTYPDDALRLKIYHALRPFKLKYNGEIVVFGSRVTVYYLAEIPDWEKSVMVQWAEKRVPPMAEAVLAAVPEIERITFEPSYSTVKDGSKRQADTKLIKRFLFER